MCNIFNGWSFARRLWLSPSGTARVYIRTDLSCIHSPKIAVFFAFFMLMAVCFSPHIALATGDELPPSSQPSSSGGSSSVLDRMSQDYDSNVDEATTTMWTAFSPIWNIIMTALVGLGVLCLIFAFGFLGINIAKALTGKDAFDKKKLGTFILAIVVGLVLTSSGWMSLLKIADTIVESGIAVADQGLE